MENGNNIVGKSRVEEISIWGKSTVELVTEVAAVSRLKTESKFPENRFVKLAEEGALYTPSRPFEFAPCVVDAHIYKDMVKLDPVGTAPMKSKNMDLTKFLTEIARFSWMELRDDGETHRVYTNARTLAKAGYSFDEIPVPDTEENLESCYYQNFKIMRITCPYFVWAQLMTHTGLSKISQSDRVCGSNEYFLPFRLYSSYRIDKKGLDLGEFENEDEFNQAFLDWMLNKASQEEVQAYLKNQVYPREIWSRAPYYFKMKTFIMGGWRNDPHAWDNLFLERNCYPRWWNNWTQEETKSVVQEIEELVMDDYDIVQDGNRREQGYNASSPDYCPPLHDPNFRVIK